MCTKIGAPTDFYQSPATFSLANHLAKLSEENTAPGVALWTPLRSPNPLKDMLTPSPFRA